jgi:hypothetical protein
VAASATLPEWLSGWVADVKISAIARSIQPWVFHGSQGHIRMISPTISHHPETRPEHGSTIPSSAHRSHGITMAQLVPSGCHQIFMIDLGYSSQKTSRFWQLGEMANKLAEHCWKFTGYNLLLSWVYTDILMGLEQVRTTHNREYLGRG